MTKDLRNEAPGRGPREKACARYSTLWNYWLMSDKCINGRRFTIEQYGKVRTWTEPIVFGTDYIIDGTYVTSEEFEPKDRRATGDDERDEADLAAFWFEAHQHGVKLEVPSPGFGLTGVVLIHVYQGNQIDVSTFRGGLQPSRVVDLSRIAEDQVWLHAGLGRDAAPG